MDLPASATSSVLFVIWSNGRHCEQRILQDLGRQFRISGVYEITWSPENVIRNYQRFYADIDVRGIYHSFSKGTGPFIAVTVTDTNPNFENRMTSRGMRYLNSRFLDAKTTYRSWAGEYTIHSSENDWETNRDMFMLFGKDMKQHLSATIQPWNGEVKKVARDLTGANGWTSEKELFGALNRAVEYVVVPGVDASALVGSKEDINLLTREPRAMHAVLGARPLEWAPIGGRYRVLVSDLAIDVGIRFPGDGFFPDALAEKLLASRTHRNRTAFYPDKRTAFSALAYHYLVHQPKVSKSQHQVLVLTATGLGVDGWTPEAISNASRARRLLGDELSGYSTAVSVPRDATVHFNRRIDDQRSGLISMTESAFRAIVSRPIQAMHSAVRLIYWQSRDYVLRSFPGFRNLKKWAVG